jgi:hypothetical protein
MNNVLHKRYHLQSRQQLSPQQMLRIGNVETPADFLTGRFLVFCLLFPRNYVSEKNPRL